MCIPNGGSAFCCPERDRVSPPFDAYELPVRTDGIPEDLSASREACNGGSLIGGRRMPGESGLPLEMPNPSTGPLLGGRECPNDWVLLMV